MSATKESYITVPTPLCHHCKRTGTVAVPEEGLRAWRRGATIQNALPEISADQREQLLSGWHPECWSTYFGD